MRFSTAQVYEDELRSCTRCALLLAEKPVDPANSNETVKPRPIVRTPTPRHVMLIGQAPGLTEYRTNTPFSGQAGEDIRALFEECGFGPSQFEQRVFTSAVAKCFPGSKLTKRRRGEGFRREDLKPSTMMLSNCRPFLLAQLELVAPRLVVLLGSMALEAYIELRTGKRSKPSLEEHVGKVEEWDGRRVVPLAHTSGTSFWLNDPSHRALQAHAKRLLAQELAGLPQ
jgi:uracil-DNA glycosylase family 4